MEGYIAEIRLTAASFAPRNWAFCNGQLLSIAQNSALFSLLGTTYGGNGQTTFGLPDLRGRVVTGQGTNSIGTVQLGEMAGTNNHVLTLNEIPTHTHFSSATP